MKLPKIIEDLLKAQAAFDSEAYARCFSETAIVSDENETYRGRNEVKRWNEKTNAQYRMSLTPMEYQNEVLTVRVAGTFPGSPIVLNYHFEFQDGLISELRIAG